MKALFPLGRVLATPGALETLQTHGVSLLELIRRHVSGDWSEMDKEDQQRNHEALKEGSRVFSTYNLSEDVRVWIITEADRSATTILLPDEY